MITFCSHHASGTPTKPESLDDYAPKHFRNHDQVVSRANLELNEKKLDNMDLKLKTIEDLIIDETIKYTGAHEGGGIHSYIY